jgi:hypothetical protein
MSISLCLIGGSPLLAVDTLVMQVKGKRGEHQVLQVSLSPQTCNEAADESVQRTRNIMDSEAAGKRRHRTDKSLIIVFTADSLITDSNLVTHVIVGENQHNLRVAVLTVIINRKERPAHYVQ